MDGAFVRAVANQLPLAEAVLRMFGLIAAPEFLSQAFKRHRGTSYEDVISFPLFVQLIADALLKHQGSGHASFQCGIEDGQLKTAVQAPYGKLRRVPISLSLGLFSEAAAQLQQLFPTGCTFHEVPRSLRTMQIFIHDGKTIKHLPKRLKVLANLQGKVIGGRLVVTQSYTTGMVVAMGADEDGESGEQPLVPDVLAQTRTAYPNHARLHVVDRQYCDLIQMGRFAEEGDHFVVRWNRKVKFHSDAKRAIKTGVDRHGNKFTEDFGWVGSPSDKRRRSVRRIHLHRPGKEDVILLTDLEDASKFLADDLLEAYLNRWGIEQMFQQVTEVFELARLISSTPKATVFQASFCFLLYNMIQIVRAYIAQGSGRPIKTISTELLFREVRDQLIAWTKMLTIKQTTDLLATTWTAAQAAHRLDQLLQNEWSDRWLKSPSNTHRAPPTKRHEYPRGGHTSVFRVIQEARLAASKDV